MSGQVSRTGADAFLPTAERPQFRQQTMAATPSNQANVDAKKAVESAFKQRQERIAVAAYYRAERRGFAPGGEKEAPERRGRKRS